MQAKLIDRYAANGLHKKNFILQVVKNVCGLHRHFSLTTESLTVPTVNLLPVFWNLVLLPALGAPAVWCQGFYFVRDKLLTLV